jgi:hypothetical protein
LMRDGNDVVLYVGKAKSLRKRLGSYRVANPDRMPKRHLRMLRAVNRIEMLECKDELSALAREFLLLRTLKPKFNRAGTWVGSARHLAWRVGTAGLDLAVTSTVEPGWFFHGPLGPGAFGIRAALLRLIWSSLHPNRGLIALPQSWSAGCSQRCITIPPAGATVEDVYESSVLLQQLVAGQADPFKDWISERSSRQNHPFQIAVRNADLETVTEFAEKCRGRIKPGAMPED